MLLLFTSFAKWCIVNRCQDSKDSTAPFQTLEYVLGILQKSQINYFSKTSLDDYFKLTSDISLQSVPQ